MSSISHPNQTQNYYPYIRTTILDRNRNIELSRSITVDAGKTLIVIGNLELSDPVEITVDAGGELLLLD